MSALFNSIRRSFSSASETPSPASESAEGYVVRGFIVHDAVLVPDGNATNNGEHSLSLKVTPSFSSIGKSNNKKQAHYAVTLTACALPDTKPRAPIDVVVAMDISGSMDMENKLNLCKKTCEILVNELNESDQFGLTVFADRARVVFPLQKMTNINKSRANDIIKSMNTEGSTNLSGGLTCAITELQGSAFKNEVRSIMLLTDGHANVGVTDPASIVNLTKSCLSSTPNISVNVFGYGCDHDADLLRKVSEASITKGSYYFIESNDNVSSAFGDCLGGLMSVAAQNIKLTIKGRGISVLFDNVLKTGENQYEVIVGDMFADESKDIVVEVSDLGGEKDDHHEIEASVSYIDIFSMSPVATEPVIGTIARPDGSAISEINSLVALQIMRIKIAKTMLTANIMGQSGNMAGAQKLIAESIAIITELIASFKPSAEDQIIINSYMSDLNLAAQTMKSSVHEYQSSGYYNMTSKCQTHTYQRSNECDEKVSSVYRKETSSKSAVASRMKKASFL